MLVRVGFLGRLGVIGSAIQTIVNYILDTRVTSAGDIRVTSTGDTRVAQRL